MSADENPNHDREDRAEPGEQPPIVVTQVCWIDWTESLGKREREHARTETGKRRPAACPSWLAHCTFTNSAYQSATLEVAEVAGRRGLAERALETRKRIARFWVADSSPSRFLRGGVAEWCSPSRPDSDRRRPFPSMAEPVRVRAATWE